MNFFSAGMRLNAKIEKAVQRHLEDAGGDDPDVEQVREFYTHLHWNEARAAMRTGIQLMKEFKAIAVEEGLIGDALPRTYWITISPRPDIGLSNADFHQHIMTKVFKRKCFKYYYATFEQRGKTVEDMGVGAHVHALAHMTQRSSSEVQRDLLSSMGEMCGAAGVKVLVVKDKVNWERIRDNYMEGVAKDGHKNETHPIDVLWRDVMGWPSAYVVNVPSELLPATKERQAAVEVLED